MKKLILIPTIILTVFLALAFVAPAAATGILKTVAPAVHVGTGVASSANAAPGNSAQAAGGGSVLSSTASSGTSQQTLNEGHSLSTPSHNNCGRFGDDSHGGKHDFPCPNRPFPGQGP